MMKLACKDINPSTMCQFEATGDTKGEVADKMLAHAKIAHPEDIKDMSDTDTKSMMESKVHE
ncbi:MAG: DUF1059 domain-containing protein [Candidatus Paceibacterota bacterium]|jgi:predicted small metal-binding protein